MFQPSTAEYDYNDRQRGDRAPPVLRW